MHRKENPSSNMTTKDIILMSAETILFLAQVVVTIFFYNFLGLNLVVALGWALLVLAIILGWRARAEFEQKGEQPKEESWLQTRTVVDTGVYAVVRHPMYLSFVLISLCLVCLSQHWLNILFGAIMVGLIYNDMHREERENIEKFGDKYHRYMEQVPRANLVLGVFRLVQRRRRGGSYG